MEEPNLQGLIEELKGLIIEVCDLQEADPGDLNAEDPLIGPETPWELDSLDAVEVIMAVQTRYDVHIDSQNTGKQVLSSLQTLAQFVQEHRG